MSLERITKLIAKREGQSPVYKLIIQKSARKELDKIPDPFFVKTDKAILALKENPYPFPQSRKLKGEDMHRLRVGDYG